MRGLRKEFPQFRKDPVLAVDKVNKMRKKNSTYQKSLIPTLNTSV